MWKSYNSALLQHEQVIYSCIKQHNCYCIVYIIVQKFLSLTKTNKQKTRIIIPIIIKAIIFYILTFSYKYWCAAPMKYLRSNKHIREDNCILLRKQFTNIIERPDIMAGWWGIFLTTLILNAPQSALSRCDSISYSN